MRGSDSRAAERWNGPHCLRTLKIRLAYRLSSKPVRPPPSPPHLPPLPLPPELGTGTMWLTRRGTSRPFPRLSPGIDWLLHAHFFDSDWILLIQLDLMSRWFDELNAGGKFDATDFFFDRLVVYKKMSSKISFLFYFILSFYNLGSGDLGGLGGRACVKDENVRFWGVLRGFGNSILMETGC